MDFFPHPPLSRSSPNHLLPLHHWLPGTQLYQKASNKVALLALFALKELMSCQADVIVCLCVIAMETRQVGELS